MTPIPFASQAYENRSLPVSAQRCVNLYPEIVPDGKNQIILHGTPGLKSFASGTGPVHGLHVMDNELYAVIDETLYRVSSSGVLTSLGAIKGKRRVSMSDNGTQLTIVNGKGYVYGSGLTKITDSDFPNASTTAFINQTTLFDSAFGFTYSALDDSASMDGTVSAMGDPDRVISILVDHLEVWVFNQESIEVWYNSGDATNPFQRLSGAFLEKGCGAKYSPAKMDNSVFWLGDDFGIYRAQGYTPVRISTPAIEYAIQSYSRKDDAFAFAYAEEGHTFYQITFPTAKKTWVYDAATQRWHERGNYTAGRHRANCYAYCYGKHLVGDFENGTIWELDLDTYLDGADPIQRIAAAPVIHNNGQDVFMSKLWIDVESGAGLTTGQGSDPQMMLNHSDDGGRTWSNERWVTMGKIGEYWKQAIWRRLGTFKSRIYRVVVSDPIKTVIIGAYGEF